MISCWESQVGYPNRGPQKTASFPSRFSMWPRGYHPKLFWQTMWHKVLAGAQELMQKKYQWTNSQMNTQNPQTCCMTQTVLIVLDRSVPVIPCDEIPWMTNEFDDWSDPEFSRPRIFCSPVFYEALISKAVRHSLVRSSSDAPLFFVIPSFLLSRNWALFSTSWYIIGGYLNQPQ